MKIRKLNSKQDVVLTALVFHLIHLIEQSHYFQDAGLLAQWLRALASHQCGRAQILTWTSNGS